MLPDYSKFREYLVIKRYSTATIDTVIRAVNYLRQWADKENIPELEDISYSDMLDFMKWSGKGGASQKTVSGYLTHIRKYYEWLISEGMIRENPVSCIKVQGIKRRAYYDILSAAQLEELYQNYTTDITHEPGKMLPPQEMNILSRRRNRVMLSLLVYQGLRVEEIAALKVSDLQLREGKIMIHAKRRTAARSMTLESSQVYELMDYLHEVRKQLLPEGVITDQLFVQRDGGQHFYSVTQMLLKQLRQINSRIKNLDQIRASVITQWLKQYDLRKVQHLAGHKYVSSTEAYKQNVLDGLQEAVNRFHPL
ncbi:integrase/recombinase XerD [Chitinophaga niastensis]|uniref:Integrase/recombinase XerD n=1 Tax=Chitinophaga niastensis TaxID=536980 RepID=A0A2P8H7S8_CHINA|nr:tyrosine-type recombinase/integrase [Chitinophaga niastensis]PSL42287.1 integrase/recombinase XerD [Chitinophaga niastensis]